jgi:DNA gyrase subunit A
VVSLIKGSKSPAEAKEQLIRIYDLSDIQSQTILDMRLQRLTGLEREKIIKDYQEILVEIDRLRKILNDDSLILKIVKDEFLEIVEQYGDERRTQIIDATDEILPEDLINPEDMAVTITHSGYIKRNPVSLYRSQHRGGKGVTGVKNIEEDFVSNLFVASTLDTFLFLTISSFNDEENNKTILMVTKYGRIKKTSLREFNKPLRKGKRALTINEGDEIIAAHVLNGQDTVLLVTKRGMCIHFEESDLRIMGRTAAGVKGISLGDDDVVVSAIVIKSNFSILIATENGYGKRSPIEEYRLQKRGGKGVIGIKKSDRNGNVIAAKQVDDEEQVILIADSGKMIRMDLGSVRIIGRSTQGVTLINLEEGEKVVGMDSVAKDRNEDIDEELLEGDFEDNSPENNAIAENEE